MSPIQAFRPQDYETKGESPFSGAIRAGDFIFLTGSGAVFEDSQESAEQAFRAFFEERKQFLAEMGITFAQVVKVTAWVCESNRFFKTWNKVYAEFFSPPYPARSTLPTPQDGDRLWFEVEMVAYVGP